MAVAAVDPQPANVMLVAERHGLLDRHADAGGPGRAHAEPAEREQAGQEESRAEDRHLGDRVCARVKDLGHPSPPAHSSADKSTKASARCHWTAAPIRVAAARSFL